MRWNTLLGPTFVLAGAVALANCGGGASASNSTPTAPSAPGVTHVHKSDEGPGPDPAPDPAPDPTLDPTPNPTPDPAGTPTALTIDIVSSFGNAFNPNPIQASVGDMLVWRNSDTTTHHIVLDDGFDVGEVRPGASSLPMSLKSSTAAFYYCTIHPSMVGSINGELPPEMPTDPPPYSYYRYRGTSAAVAVPHRPAR
jgi:plastocyanin